MKRRSDLRRSMSLTMIIIIVIFCITFYLNQTALKATTSTLNRGFFQDFFNVDKHVFKTCLFNEHCDVGLSCKNESCVKMSRHCFSDYDCQSGWKCSDHRCSTPTTAQKMFTALDILSSPLSNKAIKYINNQTKPIQAISKKLDTKAHKVLPILAPSNKTGKNDTTQNISHDTDKLFIEACNCTQSLYSRPLSSININNDEKMSSDEIDQNISFCSKVSALWNYS